MPARDSDDTKPTVDHPTRQGPTLARDSGGEVAELDAPLLEELKFDSRYDESTVLGEGGMGVVSLSSDRQIGRRVAMKRLLPSRAGVGDARARFIHEARVQGQLEHPSVVPVYDLGVDPTGALYFTMKRIRGTTLAELLDQLASQEIATAAARKSTKGKGGWSRRRLLSALSSVCLAVDFAHQRGVLHRDLKPQNIMLGDYGEVYVLDWGLARVNESAVDVEQDTALELPADVKLDATVPGTVLGTIGYMSPEQLGGSHGELTPASDVYSIGAILFEVISLCPLHPGTTALEIIESNQRGEDARASVRAPHLDVPPELDAIIVKATAGSPSDRYASTREIHEAIERFLDGERDLALRSELCERHTTAARDAIARARENEGPRFGERRAAMQQIGKALALDPSSKDAMELMEQLLTRPPVAIPEEVATEMARVERGNLKWMGKVGGYAYASLVVYLPFFLWSGIKDWRWPFAFYAVAALASAASFRVAAQRRPTQRSALLVVLFSNLAFAGTAPLFGPLFVTPMLIAVNTTGFALNLSVLHRNVAVAGGAVMMAVTISLGLLGAIPGGYSFEGDRLTITAGALYFPRVATLAFLAAVSIGAIFIGALTVTRVRDKLAAAERQLYLYTWHLREMVPEAVRGRTDPTVARTSAFRGS